MLSTLLRAGYTPAELESVELTQITEILREAFEHEGGVLGFGRFLLTVAAPSTHTLTAFSASL